jgi:hypothetical protein
MENSNNIEQIALNDITLTLLGYYPDGEFCWSTDEPFVTIHEFNGKYIFSSTGRTLNYVSDVQNEYFKFTNKFLTLKSE